MSEKNIDNIENINKPVTKRIGINTFGILLVLFGIILIVQLFVNFDLLRYLLMLWPVIFISLGVETLYYNNNPKIHVKFDIGAFICMIIVIGVGFVIAFLNFGVNKILYSDNLKDYIENYSNNDSYHYLDSGKVTVNNYTDKRIEVNIQEDKNLDYTRVITNFKYNDKYSDNIFVLLSRFENSDNFLYYDEDSVSLLNYPDYIDNIKITVITNNKENITLSGNF